MKFEPQMNADEEAMISPLKHPCRHPASVFPFSICGNLRSSAVSKNESPSLTDAHRLQQTIRRPQPVH
jgi:hypothetical protein